MGIFLKVRAMGSSCQAKYPGTQQKVIDMDNIQMLCNKTDASKRRLRSLVRMMKFSKQYIQECRRLELFICTCERSLSSLFQVVSWEGERRNAATSAFSPYLRRWSPEIGTCIATSLYLWAQNIEALLKLKFICHFVWNREKSVKIWAGCCFVMRECAKWQKYEVKRSWDVKLFRLWRIKGDARRLQEHT